MSKTGLNFVTIFDSNYILKGLTMIKSLNLTRDDICYVICLDVEVFEILENANIPNLKLVEIQEIEMFYSILLEIKKTRTYYEYIFTLTPLILDYVLEKMKQFETLFYLDADLLFFDINFLRKFDSHYDIYLTPHNFSANIERRLSKFGKYNVGLVGICKTYSGIEFLKWWGQSCLNWCFDRVEGENFADQGFLNRVSQFNVSIREFREPGINLAPWNLRNYNLRIDSYGNFKLDDSYFLYFYHFQGHREIGGRITYYALWKYSIFRMSKELRSLYRLYDTKLDQCNLFLGEKSTYSNLNIRAIKRETLFKNLINILISLILFQFNFKFLTKVRL